MECIDARTPERGSKLLEHDHHLQNGVLNLLGQALKLGLELIAESDFPVHVYSMALMTYSVNAI